MDTDRFWMKVRTRSFATVVVTAVAEHVAGLHVSVTIWRSGSGGNMEDSKALREALDLCVGRLRAIARDIESGENLRDGIGVICQWANSAEQALAAAPASPAGSGASEPVTQCAGCGERTFPGIIHSCKVTGQSTVFGSPPGITSIDPMQPQPPAAVPSDKDALKIINEYIQLLTSGHVKAGMHETTKEEAEFGISLLQAVAADIEAQVAPMSNAEQYRNIQQYKAGGVTVISDVLEMLGVQSSKDISFKAIRAALNAKVSEARLAAWQEIKAFAGRIREDFDLPDGVSAAGARKIDRIVKHAAAQLQAEAAGKEKQE